jgi:hypothetical protein
MNKLVGNTSQVRGILRRLRPPCSRSLALHFPYTFDQRVNPGITVGFPAGENVLACGSGTVIAAQPVKPFWACSPGSVHESKNSYQVVIDHGNDVRTVLHGMATVEVNAGQVVSRGDVIGTPQSDEIFIAVLFQGNAYDPQTINRHFKVQNGNVVIGQGGLIRYAPDFTVRDLSDGIVSTLVNGWRYFVPETCVKPNVLVNIDFNGNGSKTGLAASGIAATDYWNVYAPISFDQVVVTKGSGYGYGCVGVEFTNDPVVYLVDYQRLETPIWFERQFMVSNAGTSSRFDPMLSRWAGGYNSGVPYENTFSLRDVPPGNYVLYLYANEGTVPDTSTFYVSVDIGAPTVKTNTPTGTAAFVNNRNYVQFPLTLSAQGTVHIRCYGYIAGLQLKRS